MPSYFRQQKPWFGTLRKDPHWSTKDLEFFWSGRPAGKVIDETANKNDGVITDAARVSDGLDFDGTGDKVTIDKKAGFSGTTGSVVFIAKRDAASTGNILGYRDGMNNQMRIQPNVGSYDLVTFDAATSLKRIIGGAVSDDQFHHIAFTWDNGTFKAYENGIDSGASATGAGTGIWDFNLTGAGNEFFLGTNDAIQNFWTGVIATHSLYSRPLSASEITQLYRNPNLPIQRDPVLGRVAAVATNPKGPLTHPLYGPFAGPIAC